MRVPSPPKRYPIEGVEVDLYHGNIDDMHHHVPAESVDIILTDPPYPKEFLHTWRSLGAFAESALKPGGHLFAMSGHAWLPEVFDALKQPGLRYNWILAMAPLVSGSFTCIGRRIVRSTWKPILWYTKGGCSVHEQLSDLIPTGVKNKKYHHWGQGGHEFQWILSCLKRPKPAVVCDPFIGGGTTAIACIKEGYRCIACDVDKVAVLTTKSRIDTRQFEFQLEREEENETEDTRDSPVPNFIGRMQ